MASLSDLNIDFGDDTSSSSSDGKSERKVKDKLNGLCFLTNAAKDGFNIMALDDKMVGDASDATSDNSDSEVQLSTDELAAELDTCNATLLS